MFEGREITCPKFAVGFKISQHVGDLEMEIGSCVNVWEQCIWCCLPVCCLRQFREMRVSTFKRLVSIQLHHSMGRNSITRVSNLSWALTKHLYLPKTAISWIPFYLSKNYMYWILWSFSVLDILQNKVYIYSHHVTPAIMLAFERNAITSLVWTQVIDKRFPIYFH